MKTKIFALFAAMMLLVGTTAMAQSDNTSTTVTEIKGDVNNDGVVDVADIAAVIAVMHEQGTVAPQYYWYVGEVKPTDDSSIESSGKQSTSPITTINITNSNNFQYFAFPKSWGTPTLIDTSNGFEFSINKVSSLQEQFDNNPNSKYYCNRIGKNTGDITCSITWK